MRNALNWGSERQENVGDREIYIPDTSPDPGGKHVYIPNVIVLVVCDYHYDDPFSFYYS